MRETDIITQFFVPLTAGEPGSFSLTDDAAWLTPPPAQQLVVTTDSVIEGVHVLASATPAQYARKLLRRNLSDLAAMGATPWRYLLNVRVPRTTDAAWFAAFSATLRAEQDMFDLTLVGGDTTLGGAEIHLTLTALGLIDGTPLTRAGAAVGDHVYVSGSIGDAAMGLAMLQADAQACGHWVERYHTPQPRLALGRALRGIASAALDCSDGLLKDLARLCTASGVGVDITRDHVPVSADTRALLHAATNAQGRSAIWQTLLTGGDDYELIFTAPPQYAHDLQTMVHFLGVSLTAIGTITQSPACYIRDEMGLHRFSGEEGWGY